MWIECKKIWYNKKLIGGILLLFLLAMGSFLYTVQQKQVQWETWNESTYEEAYVQKEQEYLSNFHASVEAVLQQADSMGMISIFAQSDSFSAKNLEQTKADFTRLLDAEPRLVESPFLEAFFGDMGIHFFVFGAGILFAAVLLEEQKQGLRGMTYAAVNGRENYVFYKMIALLVWTGIVTILFYGGLLAVSSLYFQGDIWICRNMSIQSLSLFGNVPWNLQIGTFLLFYLLVRWMAVFFCSFVVWTILYGIDQMLIGVGAIGGLGLLSLGIYLLIDGTHAWNLFHYCNPWYWILGNDFFIEYRNLDFFSQAVNKNLVIFIWMSFCFFLCLAGAVLVGIRRYPCESSNNKAIQWGKHLLQKWKKWKSSWMSGFGVSGMEYYKILISQKGILVFVIIVGVFVYQSDFTNVQFSTSQKMYLSFVERHKGIVNESAENELEELKVELYEAEQKYLEEAVRYEAGEIPLDTWIGTSMWYQSYEQERIFLEQMTEQTMYLKELKTKRGIDGWYVNLYAYNHLLGENNLFMQVLLCFGIVLFCMGAVRVEKKSGMLSLIRGSALGEHALFRKKVKTAGCLSLFLYLIYSGLEMGTVVYVYGLDGWMAPVQSILKLEWVPISCSIGVFFILWHGLKAVGILALVLGSCWIGGRSRQ